MLLTDCIKELAVLTEDPPVGVVYQLILPLLQVAEKVTLPGVQMAFGLATALFGTGV